MSPRFIIMCFNTWAREEPNIKNIWYSYFRDVSILGLARSPTLINHYTTPERMFQYLGSRGAQPEQGTFPCGHQSVSILGLARSPTSFPQYALISIPFQYLGSRGAQLKKSPVELLAGVFQYLGSRGAQQPFQFEAADTIAVSILGLARSPTQ